MESISSSFDCKLIGAALEPEMSMVMELLSISLKSRLKRLPLLHFSIRLTYSQQIADAVHFLHQKQIIHRDLKPANILLTSDERVVKLSDFGTTRALSSDGKFGNTLRTGVLGTVGFLAPEIFTNPDEQSPAVDIFALGVTFYDILLNGDRSWRYTVDQDGLNNNLRPPPPPGTTLSERQYYSIIERCWNPDPALRPTSHDLLSMLQAVLSVS